MQRYCRLPSRSSLPATALVKTRRQHNRSTQKSRERDREIEPCTRNSKQKLVKPVSSQSANLRRTSNIEQQPSIARHTSANQLCMCRRENECFSVAFPHRTKLKNIQKSNRFARWYVDTEDEYRCQFSFERNILFCARGNDEIAVFSGKLHFDKAKRK